MGENSDPNHSTTYEYFEEHLKIWSSQEPLVNIGVRLLVQNIKKKKKCN